jgi:hypothetical protein
MTLLEEVKEALKAMNAEALLSELPTVVYSQVLAVMDPELTIFFDVGLADQCGKHSVQSKHASISLCVTNMECFEERVKSTLAELRRFLETG